jgi:energy-coupling factor transporter ATP-binding protein EcfA2
MSRKDDHWSVDLFPYDPSAIDVADCKIMVVGQSGSGKTALVQNILYVLRDKIDICIVFCPTRETREDYETFIPKCFVYEEWDPEHLDRIILTQRQLARMKLKNPDGSKTPMPLRRVAVVIDDCLYDKKDFTHKCMNYLLMNGRHEHFLPIIVAQYVVDLPKALRTQINLVFSFPDAQEGNRDALRRCVLGMFSKDKHLMATYDKLEMYEALVYDVKAHRGRKPHLFFFKAEFPLPRFRVGAADVWWMYYEHFVKQDAGNVEEFINDKLTKSIQTAAVAAVTKKTSGPASALPGIEIRRHVAAKKKKGAATKKKTSRTPKVKPPPLPRLTPILIPMKKTPTAAGAKKKVSSK